MVLPTCQSEVCRNFTMTLPGSAAARASSGAQQGSPYTPLTLAWQAGQYGGGSSSVAHGTRDSIRPGGVAAPFDAAAPPAADAARSASPSRVAHAGNGKSTASGAGNSGRGV